MRLEKWYADVADGGSVFISYSASLAIGPVALAYHGELQSGGERHGSFWLGRNSRMPTTTDRGDGGPCLEATAAGGVVTWRNAINRPRQLWSDGRRHVIWDPVVLNGTATGAVSGRGYAERLVMTVAPWRLGIERLWWGRFCGDRHSLVWIVWDGAQPLRLALLDGGDADLHTVGVEDVAVESVRLRLSGHRMLIDQTLGTGALAGMPLRSRIAPVKFLAGRECKWLAQGALESAGEVVDRGAVVFATVTWP
jgi:hypothetical protein